MINVQTTPLNASVSCRYKYVALFGVSRIFFNFIPLAWLAALAKQKLEGVSPVFVKHR